MQEGPVGAPSFPPTLPMRTLVYAAAAVLVAAGCVVWGGTPAAPSSHTCHSLIGKFMDGEQRAWWDAHRCEEAFAPSLSELRATVKRRSLGERHPGDDNPDDDTVIGIGVASTTRGLVRGSLPSSTAPSWMADTGPQLPSGASLTVDDLPLSALLRSLVTTAEPGFVYRVYVVFDVGDGFYDEVDGRPGAARNGALQTWFAANVRVPLAARGIAADLVLVSFANRLAKPAPAMNVAMHAAYDDGADFLYRVNDDTVFLTPWAHAMVAALRSAEPPLLGVVGPLCDAGNTAILTHDFTHRTHLDIFPSYYPPALTGWYVDDWMTRVYGGMNTRRSHVVEAAVVDHRDDPTKRRYALAPFAKRLLDGEVVAGVDAVLAWVQAQAGGGVEDPTTARQEFRVLTPRHNPKFPHGVYDGAGREVVPPMPPAGTAAARAAAHRRPLRRLEGGGGSGDGGQAAWEAAAEDFFVLRRLAVARRSLCAVSGC